MQRSPGGYSAQIWVEVFHWDPGMVTLFVKKKLEFVYPVYDKRYIRLHRVPVRIIISACGPRFDSNQIHLKNNKYPEYESKLPKKLEMDLNCIPCLWQAAWKTIPCSADNPHIVNIGEYSHPQGRGGSMCSVEPSLSMK